MQRSKMPAHDVAGLGNEDRGRGGAPWASARLILSFSPGRLEPGLSLEMHVFYGCSEGSLRGHGHGPSCFMIYAPVLNQNTVLYHLALQCWVRKLWPFLKVESV